MTTKIIIPKGTVLIAIPGPDGVLVSDIEVEFNAQPDQVAEGLAAAGRTDLLSLLAHKDGKMHVAYTPSGSRVEQSKEKAE